MVKKGRYQRDLRENLAGVRGAEGPVFPLHFLIQISSAKQPLSCRPWLWAALRGFCWSPCGKAQNQPNQQVFRKAETEDVLELLLWSLLSRVPDGVCSGISQI